MRMAACGAAAEWAGWICKEDGRARRALRFGSKASRCPNRIRPDRGRARGHRCAEKRQCFSALLGAIYSRRLLALVALEKFVAHVSEEFRW